jgi:hypothetical protein
MTIRDLLEKLKDVPLTMEIEGHFGDEVYMRFDTVSDDETGVRIWWKPKRECKPTTCNEFLGLIEGYEPDVKLTARCEIEDTVRSTDVYDLELSDSEVSICGNVATVFWEVV